MKPAKYAIFRFERGEAGGWEQSTWTKECSGGDFRKSGER